MKDGGDAQWRPDMADEGQIGTRVAQRRGELGMTQVDLAKRVGVTQQTIAALEKSKVRRGTRLHDIAAALRVNVDWLEHGTPARYIAAPRPAEATVGSLRDFPVLASQPHENGFILGEIRQPIDFVERPQALAGARNAFAFFVVDDSMAPRWFAGDLAVAHPDRPVRPGDFAIVTMHAAAGETRAVSRLTRLQRVYGETLHFECYAPADSFSLHRSCISALLRVLSVNDLLGI